MVFKSLLPVLCNIPVWYRIHDATFGAGYGDADGGSEELPEQTGGAGPVDDFHDGEFLLREQPDPFPEPFV